MYAVSCNETASEGQKLWKQCVHFLFSVPGGGGDDDDGNVVQGYRGR